MHALLRAPLTLRCKITNCFQALPLQSRKVVIYSIIFIAGLAMLFLAAEPAHAQNLESFAQRVRDILSSTLLRTLAVIAIILTGLLWLLGRASTQILVTVIIGIAIVFSADAIVGAIAG